MTRRCTWTVLLFALASLAFAQEKRPRIEVQNYAIDADINPRTQSITATAKIDFTPLETTNTAVFELNNALNVSKAVDQQGHALETSHSAPDFTTKVTFP